MGKRGKKGGKNEELMSKKKLEAEKEQAANKKQEANDKDKDLRTEPEAERTPGLFSILLFTITCKK